MNTFWRKFWVTIGKRFEYICWRKSSNDFDMTGAFNMMRRWTEPMEKFVGTIIVINQSVSITWNLFDHDFIHRFWSWVSIRHQSLPRLTHHVQYVKNTAVVGMSFDWLLAEHYFLSPFPGARLPYFDNFIAIPPNANRSGILTLCPLWKTLCSLWLKFFTTKVTKDDTKFTKITYDWWRCTV